MAVRPTLDNARLVVEKEREIRIGGKKGTLVGEQQRIRAEVEAQTIEDLRALMIDIADRETRQQDLTFDNPATRIIVDNREGRLLTNVTRKLEILYGDELSGKLVDILFLELRNEIAKFLRRFTRGGGGDRTITDIAERLMKRASWVWIYIPPPGSRERVQQLRSPRELEALSAGARVVLRPRIPDAEYANWARAQQTGGIGFMRSAVERLRRKPTFRAFNITVSFTRAFEPRGSEFRKQGAPMITIRAQRRRRTYPRIRR